MPPRPGSPDLYELLGVARNASAEEIRRAFREVSKRTHPDAGGNAGLFRLITEAYEVLSDPVRRREYDAGLTSASTASVTDAAPDAHPDVAAMAEREAELARREQALREQAMQVLGISVVAPGVVTPGVVPPPADVPAQQLGFWLRVRAHWLGWGVCIAAAAAAPLLWVLWAWVGVWDALGVDAKVPEVSRVLDWLAVPSPRWPAVVALCGFVGVAAFRLQVFVLMNTLDKPARQAVAGVWIFLGVALPVLPSVIGFVALAVGGAGVPCVFWCLRRLRGVTGS